MWSDDGAPGGGRYEAEVEGEFELEVLATAGEDKNAARDELHARPLDSTGRDVGAAGDIASEEEGPFTWRVTPRRRALAAGSALGAIALALVVVLGGMPGAAAAFSGLFPTPTPTATLPPGAGMVFLTDAVPWGVLTVDGRQVAPTPDPKFGLSLASLALDRGAHTLDYKAAPFPELRCRVSAPADSHDTCPVAGGTDTAFPPGDFRGSRVLDLQATIDRLPADQYAALVQALGVDPDGTTVVMAGDHFATAGGSISTATQQLQATLQISLDTRSFGFQTSTTRCPPLCPAGSGYAGAGVDSWNLRAQMTLAWAFADAAGYSVQTVPITNFGTREIPASISMDISVRWDGRWSVALPEPVDPCQFGTLPLSALEAESVGSKQLPNTTYSFPERTQQPPANGCVLFVVSDPPPGQATPGVPLARVLCRYGAMIAADDAAHRLWPQLPLPSPNERSIIAALTTPQG